MRIGSLIRLLPFLISSKIPEHDPVWQVFLNLKQIVELVVAPVQSDKSIVYLDSKIQIIDKSFKSSLKKYCCPNITTQNITHY